MYYLLMSKYREIKVISKQGKRLTFQYSLNFMTYTTIEEKSNLYTKKDLPLGAVIVKLRDVEKLKTIQKRVETGRAGRIKRIAQRLI